MVKSALKGQPFCQKIVACQNSNDRFKCIEMQAYNCTRKIVVFQDRGSLMAVVLQDRFHCAVTVVKCMGTRYQAAIVAHGGKASFSLLFIITPVLCSDNGVVCGQSARKASTDRCGNVPPAMVCLEEIMADEINVKPESTQKDCGIKVLLASTTCMTRAVNIFLVHLLRLSTGCFPFSVDIIDSA